MSVHLLAHLALVVVQADPQLVRETFQVLLALNGLPGPSFQQV